jgi:hypothetical protein
LDYLIVERCSDYAFACLTNILFPPVAQASPFFPTPPADSTAFDLTTIDTPDRAKRGNEDPTAPPSKKARTDWRNVELQYNTSGKTGLVAKLVRCTDYKVEQSASKMKEEIRQQYGKAAESIVKISVTNQKGMGLHNGGDIVTEIDMFVPFRLGLLLVLMTLVFEENEKRFASFPQPGLQLVTSVFCRGRCARC